VGQEGLWHYVEATCYIELGRLFLPAEHKFYNMWFLHVSYTNDGVCQCVHALFNDAVSY
jgi:hypothetical protein